MSSWQRFLAFFFSILIGFFLDFPLEAENLNQVDLAESGRIIILNENSILGILNHERYQKPAKIWAIVTAYSSTPWETDDTPYITASGKLVREGIVANNMLPFGTKIKIPEIFGDKIFVVEDRMSFVKGNYQFDVWFENYFEALKFGAKKTYVEIIEE